MLKSEDVRRLERFSNPYIALGWEQIGKYTPLSTQYVKQKYGKEMM